MDDLRKVIQDIETAINTKAGWEEAAGEIPQTLNDQMNQSFWQRADPDMNAWAPLKQPPSRATGRMFGEALDSIMRGEVSNQGFEAKEYVDPFYWVFQNFGTRVIPAREFYAVGDETLEAIADRTAEVISEKVLGG